MSIGAAANRRFDALARTTVHFGGRSVGAFRLWGVAGYGAGVLGGAALAAAHDRSVWLVLALSAIAAVTFAVLSACSRGEDGDVQLVAYHHQVAILGTTTATLLLAGAGVPGYLDCVAVGLGLFLVFGRMGCLMAGCCHGRPAAVGISYGPAHVLDGFPPHRAGARLLPVQAVESAWALVSVGAGVVASWHGPGAGVATYCVAYASGRFALEYLRGDGGRRYFVALSEAQWTSLALTGAIVALEATGNLPRDVTHEGALAGMAAAAGATMAVAWRGRGDDRALLAPRHLDEFAWTAQHLAGCAAVDARLTPSAGPVPSAVHVASTSKGLTVSASTLARSDGSVHHFALSRPSGLTHETAAALGRVICVLTGDERGAALPSRGGDVFHLTVVHRHRSVSASSRRHQRA
jgi:Prolipoprotein diacylglyceryl transferase